MHSQEQFTLEQAAERIYVEKKLNLTDPEVRREFIADINEQIHDRITANIIAQLSEKDAIALENLHSTNAPAQEIRTFLDQHVTDLPGLISNAILQVRNEYLSE